MSTRTASRADAPAAPERPDPAAAHIAAPRWLGAVLVVTGIIGLIGAFALSVERIHLLQFPEEQLSCDVNPFLSCSGAMESEQGRIFGFPNPFIGLMAFPASIIMGALALGGTRLPRWVWTAFSVGVLGGMVLVLWLFAQSVFVLGFVCPWCFLVWMTMYAMSFPLWTWAIGAGAIPAPAGLRRAAARLSSWGWVLSLGLAVAVVLTIMLALPGIPRFLLGGL
ncbi:vitamin K epoxide reductase family protein [Agrococcus sp. SL85]|uniref:vitamin K epoxide reductase family protein n=1 Tax=Agrococcus sp. SL85 TaxID=2995141 RepID=UPI00226CF9D3|nr:vitamin K epoxide reductase family protein [Agrococcus sp. SL85]WAC66091.1 vitamin K epoxide reductase family protein [Agrococcus sp. SL85]